MISVIIPLYNKEKSVHRSISSVLNQTYNDFEIIIVDDGSTDNSYEEVAKIKSDKIRLFHQVNKGVSAARNFGISVSKGDLIAFLDADDYWLPNHLRNIYTMHGLYPDCGMYIQNKIRLSFDKFEDFLKQEFPLEFQKSNCIYENNWLKKFYSYSYITSSIAISKSVIAQVGGFDETLTHGEDLDLWFRIAEYAPVTYYNCISAIILYYGEGYHTLGFNKVKKEKHYSFKWKKMLDQKIVNPDARSVVAKGVLFGAAQFYYSKRNNECYELLRSIRIKDLDYISILKYFAMKIGVLHLVNKLSQ